MTPTFRYEKKLWKKRYKVVAGADEVGRGAWAGPVVAAAVAFARETAIQLFRYKAIRIDDSKKLTAKQREKAEKWIKKNALSWGIGEASVSQINRLGMAKASKTAFRRAISACKKRLRSTDYRLQQNDNIVDSRLLTVDFLLIDAFYLPYAVGLPVGRKRATGTHPVKEARGARQLAIINGDEKCFSVAAASIIAKVYRDKLMRKLSQKHPRYKWSKNKGYGTREHQEAIRKYGITKLHRKAFISNVIPVPVLSQAPEDA